MFADEEGVAKKSVTFFQALEERFDNLPTTLSKFGFWLSNKISLWQRAGWILMKVYSVTKNFYKSRKICVRIATSVITFTEMVFHILFSAKNTKEIISTFASVCKSGYFINLINAFSVIILLFIMYTKTLCKRKMPNKTIYITHFTCVTSRLSILHILEVNERMSSFSSTVTIRTGTQWIVKIKSFIRLSYIWKQTYMWMHFM